jgi:hypothetical protein
MRVMLSNNTGRKVRDLAERFPGRLAHLFAPGGERAPFLPYALDNGAFGVFKAGGRWGLDEGKRWRSLLDWAGGQDEAPMWSAVPDVVGDPVGTLTLWLALAGSVDSPKRGLGLRAWVAQNGAEPHHLNPLAPFAHGGPVQPGVVFIGGDDAYKRRAIGPFVAAGHRVHVGRVNGLGMLRHCQELGVESVDGTGWLRGDQEQWGALVRFLEETEGQGQGELPWLSARGEFA